MTTKEVFEKYQQVELWRLRGYDGFAIDYFFPDLTKFASITQNRITIRDRNGNILFKTNTESFKEGLEELKLYTKSNIKVPL